MSPSELGSVAVEFALVLPLLLVLVLGTIEFGYQFFLSGSAAGAAREGARAAAIAGETGPGRDGAAKAFKDTTGRMAAVSSSPASGKCTPGQPVTVTVTFTDSQLTGFFGNLKVSGTGEMRCGG